MLKDELQQLACTADRPDGSSCKTLSLTDARKLARQNNLSLMEIELAALQLEIIPARYSRNTKTLSAHDQMNLLQSHVAVIGLGGLGGAAADILARLGVGRLTLVDGDVFDETNLNRQLLATTSQLGRNKVDVARERIEDVNPAATIRGFKEFFSVDNGKQILSGVQLVVDCLDTIDARFCLAAWCTKLQLPIISAAVAGTSGQATTIFPGEAGYTVIYGDKRNSGRGIEATLGTLCIAAYQLATMQAAEALAILLGKHAPLRNKLCLVEVAEHSTELMDLA